MPEIKHQMKDYTKEELYALYRYEADLLNNHSQGFEDLTFESWYSRVYLPHRDLYLRRLNMPKEEQDRIEAERKAEDLRMAKEAKELREQREAEEIAKLENFIQDHEQHWKEICQKLNIKRKREEC